ncbi:MAG: polyamine aminopropyltransferase [Pseudomonadota bacterium]
MAFLLLFSVFIIATCGLIYELIAGTLASYLLGDSVTQFSTIIGTYLFAMGIGSWLSRYIERNLLTTFVKIEILIGAIGGSAAALLFICFQYITTFGIPLYGTVLLIGMLVGVEIPLLLRILKDEFDFKDLVSKVFTFDYIGALAASILFPLVLVPHLGLVRSGFMFGMMNVGVALWMLYRFGSHIRQVQLHRATALITFFALLMGFVYGNKVMDIAESSMYPDPVIYSLSTPYQRIVITKAPHDLRLFLNNNLQFSSRDEYRYHETLIHTGMASLKQPKRVLILGGGDGLAAREVLKYPSVEKVTQIELDPAMTALFSGNGLLANLNDHALSSPKVEIVHRDAFLWLREYIANPTHQPYDFVVVDFPDPSNYSIGKLYSLTFFKLLRQVVAEDGLAVVQSTSPFIARKSYWCVNNTMAAAGFITTPYHAYVPSFGEWGFVLAGNAPLAPAQHYPEGLRFVNEQSVKLMLQFPSDMAMLRTEINRLDNQVLVHYFDDEWAQYGVN